MKKTMTRIAACSLAVLIAFNSALVPRSKAVGAEVVGTAALATSTLAAYMTATGVPLTVTSGGAAASAGAASLISGYAAATGATYEVVTTAIAAGATISGGTIILGAAAVAVLAGITAWVIHEYGLLKDDGSPVADPVQIAETGNILQFDDGSIIRLCDFDNGIIGDVVRVGKENPIGPFYFVTGSVYGETVVELRRLSDDTVVMSSYDRHSDYAKTYYGINVPFDVPVIECLGFAGYTSDFSGVTPIYTYKRHPDDGAYTVQQLASVLGASAYGEPGALSAVVEPGYQPLPELSPDSQLIIDTGFNSQISPEFVPDAIFDKIASGGFAPTYEEQFDASTNPDSGAEANPDTSLSTGLLRRIAIACESLADKIIDGVRDIFAPDAALTTEITDTFSEKFAFVPQLHALGTDLLNMGPDSGPPVIYIHLEDAEGTIDYGGTVKALDMSWYERYKEDGDRIIGGFLWLGFLWALFMRVSDIINGAGMAYVLGQPTIYTPEPPNDAPRLEGSRKRGKR